MGRTAKHNSAIVYLRQLCCSGLPKEVVVPEFLQAIQAVIPSGSNTLSGVDESLRSSYHITEVPHPEMDEVISAIISSFFTPQRLCLAASWFRSNPVLTEPEMLDKTFYMSDLYNVVYRRYDQHHVLIAPVKQTGKSAAMLGIYRPRQHKPFNNREQALCMQLVPYLAHALAGNDQDIRYGRPGANGIIVMDRQGKILYLTSEAKALLTLACYPVLSLAARRQEAGVSAQLARVCQNLHAIAQGKQARPPSWNHTNGRGRFTFRASWLDKLNYEQDRLIGVTIQHQEPLVLQILRALRSLPLSPTQKEVALLLAQGMSTVNICQKLHIKTTTFKDHTSTIYRKLDIQQREDLLPLLLLSAETNLK